MKYAIYYMTPESFRRFNWGDERPRMKDITDTHVHLIDIEAPDLDGVFHHMQGEVWSPNGEARPLIEEKGLRHTSMSVGDVIYAVEKNLWYVVSPVGFALIH